MLFNCLGFSFRKYGLEKKLISMPRVYEIFWICSKYWGCLASIKYQWFTKTDENFLKGMKHIASKSLKWIIHLIPVGLIKSTFSIYHQGAYLLLSMYKDHVVCGSLCHSDDFSISSLNFIMVHFTGLTTVFPHTSSTWVGHLYLCALCIYIYIYIYMYMSYIYCAYTYRNKYSSYTYFLHK
jgi:hypothetical protein